MKTKGYDDAKMPDKPWWEFSLKGAYEKKKSLQTIAEFTGV